MFSLRLLLLICVKEMEQERLAHEKEEKERAERMKKIKDQFADPNSQWEKDKTDIQNEAMKEKAKEEKAAAEAVKAAGETITEIKEETKTELEAESKIESTLEVDPATKADPQQDAKVAKVEAKAEEAGSKAQ